MTSDENEMLQFRLSDIVLINKYRGGNLRRLGEKATDEEIVYA